MHAPDYNSMADNVLNYGDSQPAADTSRSARKARPQTVTPVKIQLLQQHREEDGPLVWCGIEVGLVKLVGKVCV